MASKVKFGIQFPKRALKMFNWSISFWIEGLSTLINIGIAKINKFMINKTILVFNALFVLINLTDNSMFIIIKIVKF